MTQPVLRAENLSKMFADRSSLFLGRSSGGVQAVDSVSLEVRPGETLAVVGESGCGKSTLGRLLLRLIEPSGGKIFLEGTEVTNLSRSEFRHFRKRAQMVFQDPYGSLSPRRTIAQIIAEPLEVFGMVRSRQQTRERVAELLTQVGLSPSIMDRLPRQFSGGQRQRICIARAISVNPSFVVADEPVSALDVSVQAQVINLMQDLQKEKGFSFLFIAHDLAVVRHMAHRVAVMYLGQIVEIGEKSTIYGAPHHPYTEALLSAAPEAKLKKDRQRIVLQGDVPSPRKVPSGCRFRTRCPIAADICAQHEPPLQMLPDGHQVACHFAKPFPIMQSQR